METLPTDLLNLVSAFLSSSEQFFLSSHIKHIPEPRQSNNMLDALSTNNWGYIIGNAGEILGTVCYWDDDLGIILIKYTERLKELKIDSNYGPPLSLLKYNRISMNDYLRGCSETFQEAKEPISLPLVEYTPKAIYTTPRGKSRWRYEPVVGSVCAIYHYTNRGCECSSWVVTDIIKTKTKDKIKEIKIARITFINSTTVVYDNLSPKMACKFYTSDWEWSNPDLRLNTKINGELQYSLGRLDFNQFCFYSPADKQ